MCRVIYPWQVSGVAEAGQDSDTHFGRLCRTRSNPSGLRAMRLSPLGRRASCILSRAGHSSLELGEYSGI